MLMILYSPDELKPDKLWNSVIGRRFGTIITKRPLVIGKNGFADIKYGDLALNPEKRPTLREFQSISRGR